MVVRAPGGTYLQAPVGHYHLERIESLSDLFGCFLTVNCGQTIGSLGETFRFAGIPQTRARIHL